MLIEVVVAHYDESLAWLRDLDRVRIPIGRVGRQGRLRMRTYVYNKLHGSSSVVTSDRTSVVTSDKTWTSDVTSSDICELPLENVGREAHTYLSHIVTRYDDYSAEPAESADEEVFIVFLQGRICDHAQLYSRELDSSSSRGLNDHDARPELGIVQALLDDAMANGGVSSSFARAYDFGQHSATRAFRIGAWRHQEIAPAELPFDQWFLKYITPGAPHFPDDVQWWAAALFCVERKKLLARSRAYYKTLLSLVARHAHPEEAHYMERSWLYVFRPSPHAQLPEPHPNNYKALVCTSDNYAPVFDVFHASLREVLKEFNDGSSSSSKKGFLDLHVHALDLSQHGGSGDFREAGWHHAMRLKLARVCEFLEDDVAEAAHALVTDADIQYLNPAKLLELFQNARDEGLDFYGMRECRSREFNGGFYILRNGPAVRQLFRFVRDAIADTDYAYGDQTVLNDILVRGRLPEVRDKLKCAHIDNRHCVWGDAPWVSSHAIFHHAVAAPSVQEKVHQMARVRERYEAALKREQDERAAASATTLVLGGVRLPWGRRRASRKIN